MHKLCRNALVALAVSVAPVSSHAQSPQFASGLLWERPLSTNLATTSGGIFGDGSHDYRYRGFWVGAGVGVGLTYLSYEFCTHSDTGCNVGPARLVFTGALMGAMTGTLGALIGAQFDR